MIFNLNLFPIGSYNKGCEFRLTHLDPNMFKELKNLEWLDLRWHNLTFIEEGLFSGLNNLKWLSLGYNQLTDLDEGAFKGLIKLVNLDLRDNKFASIQSQVVFRPLVNLKELSLDKHLRYSELIFV